MKFNNSKKKKYSKPYLSSHDSVQRITKDVSVASEDGQTGRF